MVGQDEVDAVLQINAGAMAMVWRLGSLLYYARSQGKEIMGNAKGCQHEAPYTCLPGFSLARLADTSAFCT